MNIVVSVGEPVVFMKHKWIAVTGPPTPGGVSNPRAGLSYERTDSQPS